MLVAFHTREVWLGLVCRARATPVRARARALGAAGHVTVSARVGGSALYGTDFVMAYRGCWCRVQVSGFRVQGSGFRVQGSGSGLRVRN